MDSGEYINKVQMYHGTLASTIDGSVHAIMAGIRFITNKGTNKCFVPHKPMKRDGKLLENNKSSQW